MGLPGTLARLLPPTLPAKMALTTFPMPVGSAPALAPSAGSHPGIFHSFVESYHLWSPICLSGVCDLLDDKGYLKEVDAPLPAGLAPPCQALGHAHRAGTTVF